MDAYMALTQPEASQWPPSLKQHATDLRMFSVRQPFPLLMAARRALADSPFATVLRACVIISFRYNVIGSHPTNEQERIYNAVAEKISRKQLTDAGAILSAMSSVYPSDDAFRAAFAEKSIRTTQSRNKRVVRYILCALEKQLTGNALDFDADSFNLEHILPENPETGWENFSDDEVEALVYRLGNLTLLSTPHGHTAKKRLRYCRRNDLLSPDASQDPASRGRTAFSGLPRQSRQRGR